MPSATLLAALLLANLLSLCLLNALRLPVWALLPTLPLSALLSWRLLRSARLRPAPFPVPRAASLLSLSALLLLTAPRLPYFAEWLPGAAVLAQADDYGRLAELVSLTLGPNYPVPHPSNQEFLLSHYYAALLPMAWIKLACPVFTLKDAITLGNLLYHILFLLALLEIAPRLTPSPRAATTLVFFTTLFGGLDLLMGHWQLLEHTEHWQRAVTGHLREFSSFYTANFWTVHHMASFWAAVLALFFTYRARFQRPWQKPLLAAALLVSAFASSAFVVLSIPLLFFRELLTLLGRLLRPAALLPATLPAALLAAVPLWLYTGRPEGAGFLWNPVPYPLPLYLLAVFVIEYAGLPLFLAFRWRALAPPERRWFAGALLLFAVTWGLESAGYNNFGMRASLLPAAVIFLLAARHLAFPRLALAVAALATLTTLQEAATMTYRALEFSNWYWLSTGRPVPPHVAPLLRSAYPRLARDPSQRFYSPDPADRTGLNKFNAEKLVQGLPVAGMETAERELLRRR